MRISAKAQSTTALELPSGEHLLDLPSSLLDLLPIGVYVCDAVGRIIRYNRAASEMWGREPKPGDPADRFCGSHRLYGLDGKPVARADCPMAKVLRGGAAVRNGEIAIERPDGSRIVAAANIDPLKDEAGCIIGAVNCLMDVTDRHRLKVAAEDAELPARDLLEVLPAAIYTTDAAGLITFYNQAAVDLWGCRPKLGEDAFCGSWKLYWPDGTPLPHDQCPMAVALRERRAVRNSEAVVERPDGTRVPFVPFPTPLYDRSGRFVGAVNVLVDISDRKRSSRLLAAIVDSSDDAILTKDLEGVITTWNGGAQRLFGYTSVEAIGNPVTMLIPSDRHSEERTILARIRAGERIDHYETVRRRKDGSLVDISLTVSPVKDETGRVVGASKVARDITERRRALQQQQLLLREMNHRVKNLFALAGGIVGLSAGSAQTVRQLSSAVNSRLAALARAHSLTLPDLTADGGGNVRMTTLHALLRTILSPYDSEPGEEARFAIEGADHPLSGSAITSFALLFNEFATNAAKYGSLSTPHGTVAIRCTERDDSLHIQWTERGGPPVQAPASDTGFGRVLVEATVKGQLGGWLSREWTTEGLIIHLSAARDRCTDPVKPI